MVNQYLVNFNTRQLPEYQADLIIIGTGLAGLFCAWTAAQKGAEVILLTKKSVYDSNTYLAQGGIAVAIDANDAPEIHFSDTITAGAGLCNEDAVKVLVNEGIRKIQDLIKMGVPFDKEAGEIAFTREGCHSRRRILHSGGDATGKEIIHTLISEIRTMSNVRIMEEHFAIDLLTAENICYGVLALDIKTKGLKIFRGKATVLATGGSGQVYRNTTNPSIATADGIAMAYRCGAEIMDMEFVQFHPTVLNLPDVPKFLISEAVRGEGGILRNDQGERFMTKHHEMAELAPRDIVSRAIVEEMDKNKTDCVFLDVTHLDPKNIMDRFPNITAHCKTHGLDITKEWIPVAPAAHYMMGGVKTDIYGRTSIKALYCCGEAGCTGVHGANRLASNSLLDAIVFGARVAEDAAFIKARDVEKIHFECSTMIPMPDVDFNRLRQKLRYVMEVNAGQVRTAHRLVAALSFFADWAYLAHYECYDINQMETLNMMTVGKTISEMALLRNESRGGQMRLDFPETVDFWRKHSFFMCGEKGRELYGVRSFEIA